MDANWLTFEKILDPATRVGALFLALVLGLLAWGLALITTRLMKRLNWVIGKLKLKVDETAVRSVLRFKDLAIFLLALLIYAGLVPGLRTLMGTLLAGAGITALVIGFAARFTLANLISGLSIALYRPFRIGDNVTIEGEYGLVEDITLRHTIVRTWDNKRLIIPNEKIDNMTLVNHSIIDPRILCGVEFRVSYDTDLDRAKNLILAEAEQCPFREQQAEKPQVQVVALSDSAVVLKLFVWVPNSDTAWQTRFWLLEQVENRFDREGIEIPFAYRTVVFKKDLPLSYDSGSETLIFYRFSAFQGVTPEPVIGGH